MADAAPVRPPLEVPEGYEVGGWTVTGLIGSGSWGSVYTAQDAGGRPAALKFLGAGTLTPGQRSAVGDLVGKEVRFSLAARHPHLVRTHQALTVDDPGSPGLHGAVVLVMDRARRSVQDLLDAADPGAPVEDAERILRGAAAGLAHLHGAGWLHGDLKPGNILLGPQQEVWLADFGLTTELEGTHAYVPPMGTLDHMPPEWWSERTGSRGTAVRLTADIWAFGVVAHQVLAGGLHPFPGASARARALAAQSYARGRAPLRLDPGLPDGWRQLITECLAPDHAARAALTGDRLGECVADLPAPGAGSGDASGAGSGDASGAPSGAGPGGPSRRSRRRSVLPAVLAAAVAAAVATAVTLTGGGNGGGGPTDAPVHASALANATAAVASGELPARSDVPQTLIPYIVQAAHLCVQEEVTPTLIAAMLKAESGFDAKARRPQTDEYGIAMWTPRVFEGWKVDGDRNGTTDYMSPPDAIATMGSYLCWIDGELKAHGMRKDLPELTAAAYRTSVRTIIDAGGVPARVQPYIDKVHRYLADYTAP